MRTIKFRGKSVDYGTWRYGSLIIHEDGSMAITGGANEFSSQLWSSQVHPESVGQWTGLVDRNGKEIFEGDVLRRDGHQNMFIKFYKGAFCLVSCDPVQRANWSPVTCRGSDIIYREIIGNIIDSPELMEVE